jgi:hypothetical protein
LTLEVTNDGTETLYWRVIARNEFGFADASPVHALYFVQDSDDQNPDDMVDSGLSSHVSALEASASGTQAERGDDDAAGCAGTQGAGSLAAMLAAITGALAVMRVRRKHA